MGSLCSVHTSEVNMRKFILPEGAAKKGKQQVSNYVFTNGELEVDDETASKLEPILCRFYGCTMAVIKDAEEDAGEDDSKANPSLAKTQTAKA